MRSILEKRKISQPKKEDRRKTQEFVPGKEKEKESARDEVSRKKSW